MIIDIADADYKLKTGSNEPALIENLLIKILSLKSNKNNLFYS